MKYDFDRVIDRSGTHALKWDCRERTHPDIDVLPMWVADMDFETAPSVREAVRRRAGHGIFGYTLLPDDYRAAVAEWMAKRFNWNIQAGWMAFTPGVVPAVHFAVQAFSRPGDGIVIQSPVYYPFRWGIERNGRRVMDNPLQIEGGRYVMDLEGLEAAIDDRTRMLILCSPHNPVGRVWRREELHALAEICRRRDLVLLSDEVHADLVMPGHRHLPTACLGKEFAGLTITCTAPNKTFNIAGLQMATTIIPNRSLRSRFQAAVSGAGIGPVNPFSIEATIAAYRDGEEWMEALLEYLHANFIFLQEFFADRLPRVKVYPLEGTYLVWADFSAYGLPDREMTDRLLKIGRVWLDAGSMFGTGGEGHQRINIACPRRLLKDGLEGIARSLEGL